MAKTRLPKDQWWRLRASLSQGSSALPVTQLQNVKGALVEQRENVRIMVRDMLSPTVAVQTRHQLCHAKEDNDISTATFSGIS